MSSIENAELLRDCCYRTLRTQKHAKAHLKNMKKAYHTAYDAFEISDHEATEAIEAYAQFTCLALIDKIHIALPRELRDAIWRALIASWPIETYFDDDVTTSHGDEYEGKAWHLMRTEYMGLKSILEIQEEYFRSTKFYFISDNGAHNLRIADPLDLGILAGDFALDVEFEYSCEIYAFEGVDQSVNPANAWGGWAEPLLETNELLMRLGCLLGFKKGTSITLHLKMDAQQLKKWKDKQDLMWKEVIPYIHSTIRKLSLAGRKITIRIEDEYWAFKPSGAFFSKEDWKRVVDDVEEDENDIYIGIEDLFLSSED